MISAVIIEDEPKGRQMLKQMLSDYCPELELLGMAKSAKEGYDLILSSGPDLVFLDVEMPNGSGFDLLDMFDDVNFQLVFTTAYGHYALQAIKYSALDFLLKPIDGDDLIMAVEKAEENKNLKKGLNGNVQTLMDNVKGEGAPQKMAVPDFKGVAIINVQDIVRCEADGNYTTLFLNEDIKITSTRTLKQFEDMLELDGFMRVHRTHLINLRQVTRFEKEDGGMALMTNGDKIEISRRRKQQFVEFLANINTPRFKASLMTR